jgi:hypothetical protein
MIGWFVGAADTEVGAQFHPDGANFEASTSYHRLSAEMVTYAAALALSLPADKQAALPPAARAFPTAHSARLERMAEFVQHITKPSGLVPQIGDNDSGRFLKLLPIYETMTVDEARGRYANLSGYQAPPGEQIYWDEIMLDHRHLVAAINGLFGRDDLTAFSCTPEKLSRIVGGRKLPRITRPVTR